MASTTPTTPDSESDGRLRFPILHCCFRRTWANLTVADIYGRLHFCMRDRSIRWQPSLDLAQLPFPVSHISDLLFLKLQATESIRWGAGRAVNAAEEAARQHQQHCGSNYSALVLLLAGPPGSVSLRENKIVVATARHILDPDSNLPFVFGGYVQASSTDAVVVTVITQEQPG